MSEAVANACPVSADFLPQNMRKHVDPAAPVPLRMMAAKALVPVGPSEMVGLLFMLTYDADPAVRETAQKTAASLADRILSSALRDQIVTALTRRLLEEPLDPVVAFMIGHQPFSRPHNAATTMMRWLRLWPPPCAQR